MKFAAKVRFVTIDSFTANYGGDLSRLRALMNERMTQGLKRCMRLLSDESFDRIVYWLATHKRLNVTSPKTYTEKLLYIKRNDHNPLMTICADKFRVYGYLKDIGFGRILKQLYGVYDDPCQVNLGELPDTFFIKCNHASHGNYLITPSTVTVFPTIQKKLKRMLKQNYYWQSREWAYKEIRPRVICEEALLDDSGNLPVDYKFYCFDGQVRYFMVSIGEYEHHVVNHKFDRNGRSIDWKFKKEPTLPESEVHLPDNLSEMVEVADQLSKPFRHVRVDLYNLNSRIVFGEFTFYSSAGFVCIPNEQTELELGKALHIGSDDP